LKRSRRLRIHVEKLTHGVDADDPNADPVPEISPGDTVTWEYIVTNIGTVPLSNVNVEDDQLASIGVTPTYVSGDTNNNGLLDLTETWIYRATGVADNLSSDNWPVTQCGPGGSTQPTYGNMGTVTGQFSQTVVMDDDSSHYCNRLTGCQHDCGDTKTKTPTPPPPPTTTPVVQVIPTPVLPVQFLPETGIRGVEADKVWIGITLLLVALGSTSLIIIRGRRK
jgi:hypothetical protein